MYVVSQVYTHISSYILYMALILLLIIAYN